MADNETSYLPIGTCLEQIEKAVYGREVRKAIHDGIAQCYDDTVEGVNAAQQAASDTQDVIDNAVTATNAANKAASEASNVKVEQTVSGDTVTFTTTKRDGTTVSTSFQKPNIVVSKDEGSGEFSVTAKGWNGEEIVAKIPDPSEEVKSRATITAVSKVKTALGNPLTITDGMDAPAVKTVVTLEPKQDLHGYDHPWVGGAGKNLLPQYETGGSSDGLTWVVKNDGRVVINGTATATVTIDAPRSTWMWDGVTDCWLSGCPAGGNTTTGYSLRVDVPNSVTIYSKSDTGAGVKFESASGAGSMADSVLFFRIVVRSGTVCNNLTFAPQLELGSTATPYEPYSNICPIEGYDTVRVTATGKNLLPCTLNNKTVNNVVFKKQSDGSYLLDGVASANIGADRFYIGDGYFLKPNTKYVLSGSPDGGSSSTYRLMAGFNDATITFTDTGNGVAFTTPSSWTNFMVYPIVLKNQNMAGKVFAPMIRLATEEDSTYEPFGSTTSLSVAQAAGATVYGGTVTLNEDGSGTLVVDRAVYTANGSETYGASNTGTNRTLAYSDLPDARKSTNAVYIVSNGIAATAHSSDNTGIVVSGRTNLSGYAIGVENDALGIDNTATVDQRAQAMKTYLASNPIQFVYYLATPATYTLTADQLRTLTGKNHVWTDGTKLELTYRADKYADVEKFLNAIPTGTKTGDPAVFADGADDLPFEKLTIAVEPHQEGTGDPSPDNVRPITGWDEVKVTRCGKNLFDPVKAEMMVIDAGGTQRYGCSFDNLPAGQYTVSVVALGDTIDRSVFYKYYNGTGYSSSTRITNASTGSGTVSLPEGCRALVYVDATNASAGSNALANIIGIQFEAGSTATSYEPYTYVTLPISLKYATGSTVYGGTVTVNRDGTGSVVVDRAMVTFDGDENWNIAESAKAQFVPVSTALPGANRNAYEKVICSHLKMRNTTQSSNLSVGEACYNAAGTNWLVNIGFTSAADLKAYLVSSPMTVVYPLATPTTYTLTVPQLTSLLGNNTVWCDAGQVTVKYKRDIGKMISNLYAMLVESGAIVVENEEDVTVEGPHYNP